MKYSYLVYLFSLVQITYARNFWMQEEYGSIQLGVHMGNKKEYYSSYSHLNFTINDCKNLKLCPNDLTSDKFIDFFDGLDQFKVFNQVINDNQKFLSESFNSSSRSHRFTFEDDGVYQHTDHPRSFHRTDKSRLISVVPVFIISLIISLIIYLQKRKLLIEYNFKFSNLSLILIKYLIAKLFFTILYLIQLVLFDDFEMKSLGSTIILVVLSAINFTFSIAAFALVALFAFGYCTVFFSLRNRREINLKVAGLVLLYTIQTFPKFLMELHEIENSYFLPFDNTPITIGRIVLYVGIIGAISYTAYSTYKNQTGEDQRYSLSCIFIAVGYLLNPLIVIPHSANDMLEFLKQKYASNTEIWEIGEAYGIHVPEIIELVVIALLIYIWRDLKYVEKDEKDYSSLPTSETS